MSFLDIFKRPFSRKESQALALLSVQSLGRPVGSPRDYKGFSEEAYQKNVIAYKCISLIAQSSGGVKWNLFSTRKGAQSTEIEDHEILDLLLNPNPMQGQSAFIEAVVSYRLIAGNSFIEGVNAGDGSRGPINELWALRPDLMKVIPGSTGVPQGYQFTVNGLSKTFAADVITGQSAIMHLKTFHPTNPWYGMSAVEAAVYGIDQHNQTGQWNLALLQNSGVPSGVITQTVTEKNPSGSLSDDQREFLKEQINNRYTGSKNAGRVMMLEGGLDWKQMGINPKDMDWVQGKNTSARDIALAFGVPPQLLGIPGDNTYANYKEARLAFYEETVLPALESLKHELNRWLTPRWADNLLLDYDKDSIDALAPKREALWDRVDGATDLTVNEKRIAKGYEPLGEEGDVVLVLTTQTTLEKLIKEPAAPPPGMPGAPAAAATGTGGTADPAAAALALEDEELEDDADPGDEGKPKGARSDLETKLFDLSPEKKKKAQRSLEILQNRHEINLKKQVKGLFHVEGAKVAHAVKGLSGDHAKSAALAAIASNRSSWTPVMQRALTKTMHSFGDKVIQSFKSYPGVIEAKANTRFTKYVEDWVEAHTGELIQGLEETSRDEIVAAIQDAISSSYQDNAGPPADIAEAIQEAYDGFTSSRATLIARTETVSASNAGSLGAAKSLGIQGLQKEWVATNDERTRADHVEANGQLVDQDAKFDVGGAQMEHPGDPNADASEICNCRCVMVYSKPKGNTETNDDDGGSSDTEGDAG